MYGYPPTSDKVDISLGFEIASMKQPPTPSRLLRRYIGSAPIGPGPVIDEAKMRCRANLGYFYECEIKC